MAHIIKYRISTLTIASLILLLACSFAFIVARYYYPANLDQMCDSNSPLLVNDIHSCSLIEQVVSNLEHESYTLITLEKSNTSRGPFKARFDYKIFEINNYKIEGDPNSGVAQFRFINGRLSSIAYTPKNPESVFNLYPEKESNETSVRHSTNYQGLKYISWSNNQLESYITWWIRRFA